MSELIKDNAVSAETTKVRYSDEELEEFRTIINDMLDKARKEYNTLRRVIMHNGSNDIEDTTPSFSMKKIWNQFPMTLKCSPICMFVLTRILMTWSMTTSMTPRIRSFLPLETFTSSVLF